jgi:hypothetical protein
MHMPRQVVGSERSKANPVKRLRAHTLTLASRTESDKGKLPFRTYAAPTTITRAASKPACSA